MIKLALVAAANASSSRILCLTRGIAVGDIDRSRSPRPINKGKYRGSPAISPQMLMGIRALRAELAED